MTTTRTADPWASVGADLGRRLAGELRARAAQFAPLLEAARAYAPPDLVERAHRAASLALLGFSPMDRPTDDQVTAAYREIARTCHPDVSPDPEAHARFVAATSARDFLLGRREAP